MRLSNYLMTILFVGFSFFSISQHKYSLEVESFNGKQPTEVLDEITQYIVDYNKYFEDGIFFFESKILYTEENFREISAVTGYIIKEFKVLSDIKEEDFEKELDK